MSYQIQILDKDKKKVAVLKENISASVTEELNGPDNLTLKIADRDKWSYVTGGETFIRIFNLDDSSYKTYRVKNYREIKTTAGVLQLEIHAEHVKLDMRQEIYPFNTSFKDIPLGSLLSELYTFSDFTTGEVFGETDEIDYIEFNYDNVLYCVEKILEKLDRVVTINETKDPIEVDFKEAGATDSGVRLQFGKNLKGISRKVNYANIKNKVYGIGGGDPPLDFFEAARSGSLKYVQDPDSIAQYGLREGVYQNTGLESINNLVAAPALNQLYTGGLCEGWTQEGSPTLSENTNTDYLIYGTKSQKIVGAADGDGISQAVTVDPGQAYSMQVSVYVEAGSVRIDCIDGTTIYSNREGTSGTGWLLIEIEDFWVVGTSVQIKIVQNGAAAATFYVDAVQLTVGAQNKDFVIGNSADLLWEETYAFLQRISQPDYNYEINLIDLYKSDPAKWEYEQFELGESVQIYDMDIGIDVTARVIKQTWDVLDPQNGKIEVSTRLSSLVDHIVQHTRLARDIAEDQRVLARRSMTIGNIFDRQAVFNTKSFTWDGTFYSTAYNGFGWSSGTLRVAGATYIIASDTKTGLDASSTYFVYFDRTDPTTLGATKVEAEAHTVDRLFMGTVFTQTVDDEGCAIFPVVGEGTYLGKHVVAGQIESYNWGVGSGSQFNLNDGTFYLGGSVNPKLSWDGATLSLGDYLPVGSDLDDIPDGASYARVLKTDISAGHILLTETIGDLDDIGNGVSYGRILNTSLSAGNIRLTSLGVYDPGYDPNDKRRVFTAEPTTPYDVGDLWFDGSVIKRCTTARATGAYVAGDWTQVQVDELADGTYGKVFITDIQAGHIELNAYTVQTTDYNLVTDNEETGAARGYTGLDDSGNLKTKVLPGSAVGIPGAQGLYLGTDYLGYYDGSDWKVYIQGSGADAGDFYFKGNANNYITWDGTTFNIRGSLNADDIQAGTITGRTVQSAASGTFVKLDAVNHWIAMFNTSQSATGYIKYDAAFNGINIYIDPVAGGYIRLQAGGLQLYGATRVQGHLTPDADGVYDLGSGVRYWKDLHLGGNAIVTGAGSFARVDVDEIKSSGDMILNGYNALADSVVYVKNDSAGYQADLNVERNIIAGGTVDGRDIAADGTKLDGLVIDSVADADTTHAPSRNWGYDHAANANAHHAQAHTLASHSTKAHSELTGIGASDHHAKTALDDTPVNGQTAEGITSNWAYDHSVSNPNAHHNRSHNHSLSQDGNALNPSVFNMPGSAPGSPVVNDMYLVDNADGTMTLYGRSAYMSGGWISHTIGS